MTEGIRKERLIYYTSLRLDAEDLLDRLIDECTDLDPWIPIENAPKDKELLMFTIDRGQLKGSWANYPFIAPHASHWQDDRGIIICPTHYKLLPKDPK